VRANDYSMHSSYGSRLIALFVPAGTISNCSVIANLELCD
jgi:hypothetical protein